MAIIKYIAVHQSPMKFLRCILNGDKTDQMKLATGLNCQADVKNAYTAFCTTFENNSNERFYKKSLSGKDGERLTKEKIRLHHYIQSFKPGEVTPEEAHKIGVEWAQKVFGENHQVLVTTHVDRQHIHNHFAVAAYDLDGKAWLGNKTTLQRCRDISDKIVRAHGLSVIEKPAYHANQRYSDWLARKTRTSWKQKLCDNIDELVLRDDVQSVEDLAQELRQKGYTVTLRKYLSVKANANMKAVRTYRLGDGYAIEELRYRIVNKNREISLAAIEKYQGIQREYALCLRELQIAFYRNGENPNGSSYSELRRNTELLTFLCERKIQSVAEFEDVVNSAAEKSDSLKKSCAGLKSKIEREEKIAADGKRYLELLKIPLPKADEYKEIEQLNYLGKFGLRSEQDLEKHAKELERLKVELSETEKSLEVAEAEKSEAARNYQTYLRQMQSDYNFILERLRREREESQQAERAREQEQEQDSQIQNRRRNGNYL